MITRAYVNGEYKDIEIQLSEEELKLQKLQEIEALKAELATYDYIGVKIAMGVATKEDYADKIAYTETLRAKINELQEEIG